MTEYFEEMSGAFHGSKIEMKPAQVKESPLTSVLEVVTTVSGRPAVGSVDKGQAREPKEDAIPPGSILYSRSTRIHIFSPRLINALRPIMDFYPSQDLVGDRVEVPERYRFLVHHRDQLNLYKSRHPAQHDEEYRWPHRSPAKKTEDSP